MRLEISVRSFSARAVYKCSRKGYARADSEFVCQAHGRRGDQSPDALFGLNRRTLIRAMARRRDQASSFAHHNLSSGFRLSCVVMRIVSRALGAWFRVRIVKER